MGKQICFYPVSKHFSTMKCFERYLLAIKKRLAEKFASARVQQTGMKIKRRLACIRKTRSIFLEVFRRDLDHPAERLDGGLVLTSHLSQKTYKSIALHKPTRV